MTNDERQFVDIANARGKGGYLPIEALSGELSELKSYTVDFIQELKNIILAFDNSFGIKEPEPFIGLIDSETINAFAKHHNGTNFIGIHKGMIVVLKNVFQIFMSFNSVRLRIGNSNLEENPVGIFGSLPSSGSDFPNGFYRAKDRKRAIYGEILYKMAALHIGLHEFCHLRRGHFEIKKSDFLRDNTSYYKALEFDADLSATHLLVSYVFSIFEGKSEISNFYKSIFTDIEEILEMLFIAIEIRYYLSFNRFDWANDVFNSTHPPPPYRPVSIISQAMIVIETKSPDLLQKMLHRIPVLIEEVKRFFELSTGKDTLYEPIDQYTALMTVFSSYNDEISRMRREIMDNFKHLAIYPDPLGD